MMKTVILSLVLTSNVNCLLAQKFQPEAITAEQAGFGPAGLDSLTAFLEKSGSSSLMILVEGKVAYSWGEVDRPHLVHSIRKALLNSLIGIEVAKGRIDTTMTVGDLGIDDVQKLSELEKSATVADILKSRSGIYHPAAAVHEGMLRGMPKRDTHQPGSHYYYNNWDFNVIGAILEERTGKSIYDLFLDQIAKPIGMHDYTGSFSTIDGESEDDEIPQTDGIYQEEKSKSLYPAYHFRMSTRDLALYGQLYLQNGRWNGEQVVPEEWIKRSTQAYSVTDERYGIGYGMLWKVLMETDDRASSSFYHTGLGIHMLGIYPASNLVLVHRVDTEKEYSFHEGKFYQMIGLVWGARKY